MALLIEYISKNIVFFGILFGTIALTVLVYVGYSQMALKKPKRKISHEPSVQTISNKTIESDEPKSDIRMETGIKVVDGEIATVFKAQQDLPHPLEELSNPKTTPSEDLPTSQLGNNLEDIAPRETTEAIMEDAIPKKSKKPLGKYHVMFRQSDQKWIVKRENSSKIVRALETQKEAISYATIKALTNDTTVVIHKKDGKIRKQNYAKSVNEDETES